MSFLSQNLLFLSLYYKFLHKLFDKLLNLDSEIFETIFFVFLKYLFNFIFLPDRVNISPNILKVINRHNLILSHRNEVNKNSICSQIYILIFLLLVLVIL